jgi:hypothetical protein
VAVVVNQDLAAMAVSVVVAAGQLQILSLSHKLVQLILVAVAVAANFNLQQ